MNHMYEDMIKIAGKNNFLSMASFGTLGAKTKFNYYQLSEEAEKSKLINKLQEVKKEQIISSNSLSNYLTRNNTPTVNKIESNFETENIIKEFGSLNVENNPFSKSSYVNDEIINTHP